MAALLDRTMSRGLRHCLLRLLEALLIPRCGHSDEAASQAARANAVTFVEAGGVQLAVDLVAGVAAYYAPAQHLLGHVHWLRYTQFSSCKICLYCNFLLAIFASCMGNGCWRGKLNWSLRLMGQ